MVWAVVPLLVTVTDDVSCPPPGVSAGPTGAPNAIVQLATGAVAVTVPAVPFCVAEPCDMRKAATDMTGSSTTTASCGNLKYTVDFRSVYQTMIRDWLQGDATSVLGAAYPELSLINTL
jgi:hypothetical protein